MDRNMALDFVRVEGDYLTLEELGWYSRHHGLKDPERKQLAHGLKQLFGAPKAIRMECILGTIETSAYLHCAFRSDVFESLGMSEDSRTKEIAFTRRNFEPQRV
jgi:hypothetical protein